MRHSFSRAASLVVVGLVLGVASAVSAPSVPVAQAAPGCEANFPINARLFGSDRDDTFWAAPAAGDPATITVSALCAPAGTVVDVTSNSENLSLDVNGDGTGTAGFILTPPTPDYTGVAQLDVTLTSGSDSADYRLVGYFGVPVTSYPSKFDVSPLEVAAGAGGLFTLTGLSLSPGLTGGAAVVSSSEPVEVEFVSSPTPGVVVTPAAGFAGVVATRIIVTDGFSAQLYDARLWVGVSIPDGVVWGPNPGPVAIEPGGTGVFRFPSMYAPPGSECEIRVLQQPDIEISTEPVSLSGEAQNIPVTVLDPEFVGLLTVTYGLTCNPPTGPSSAVDYMLLLYVGIPIPADELAATGPSMDVLSLAAGGLALGGIVLLLADRRRRRHAH
jgi:LPXTG-motif cell wall-anchored protein